MATENPYAPPEADVSVSDPTELAGRWARLGGAFIDGIVILVVIFPLMLMTGYWQASMAGEVSITSALLMGLTGIGVFMAVNGYLLAKHGQTIGKRLVKTRIVSVVDEKILPFWKVITLRYLPVWVIGQIPLIGVLFSSLIDPLFIFRSDKRCVHDHIAGTKVIKAQTF